MKLDSAVFVTDLNDVWKECDNLLKEGTMWGLSVKSLRVIFKLFPVSHTDKSVWWDISIKVEPSELDIDKLKELVGLIEDQARWLEVYATVLKREDGSLIELVFGAVADKDKIMSPVLLLDKLK